MSIKINARETNVKLYPRSRYSVGDMPVCFLKNRLKDACSEKPIWSATCWMVRLL